MPRKYPDAAQAWRREPTEAWRKRKIAHVIHIKRVDAKRDATEEDVAALTGAVAARTDASKGLLETALEQDRNAAAEMLADAMLATPASMPLNARLTETLRVTEPNDAEGVESDAPGTDVITVAHDSGTANRKPTQTLRMHGRKGSCPATKASVTEAVGTWLRWIQEIDDEHTNASAGGDAGTERTDPKEDTQ